LAESRTPDGQSPPAGPRVNAALYLIGYSLIKVFALVFYRPIFRGVANVPMTGPVIVVMNHQSNFDPPIAGTLIRRKYLMFIARVGLFRSRFFGWLIRSVGAIPIRRGEPDLPAIKTAIARLKQRGAVVVFAEGARTPHGQMQPFQKGTMLLLKRGKAPVLPVGIDGFRDAWARGSSRPTLFGPRIAVNVGEPIDANELLAMPPDNALRRLGRVVDDLRLGARAELRRVTNGARPRDTVGDAPAPTERWYTDEDHMPEALNDAAGAPTG
jgi:1-acyl-sn-glycerol-3-phosphate acyltransferase